MPLRRTNRPAFPYNAFPRLSVLAFQSLLPQSTRKAYSLRLLRFVTLPCFLRFPAALDDAQLTRYRFSFPLMLSARRSGTVAH